MAKRRMQRSPLRNNYGARKETGYYIFLNFNWRTNAQRIINKTKWICTNVCTSLTQTHQCHDGHERVSRNVPEASAEKGRVTSGVACWGRPCFLKEARTGEQGSIKLGLSVLKIEIILSPYAGARTRPTDFSCRDHEIERTYHLAWFFLKYVTICLCKWLLSDFAVGPVNQITCRTKAGGRNTSARARPKGKARVLCAYAIFKFITILNANYFHLALCPVGLRSSNSNGNGHTPKCP